MTGESQAYFGDIHNHCNMSYAHGNLSDAIANARQRLDFCSVTGHAHWTDMPARNGRIDHIIDFHERGFAKLAGNWQESLRTVAAGNEPGRFLTFPGFEVHSSANGDRTIVYRDLEGELLYPETIGELQRRIRELTEAGRAAIALPHHIGYHQGARGINWDSFDESTSPIVEIYSMHGAAETTEGPIPYLHSMGPPDWRSTVQYGLASGHVFGFSGNTDHHSAHPGSYGHGMTGLWAPELSREAVWEAIHRRRTFALTGDRMRLDYRLRDSRQGDTLMGGIRPPGPVEGLTVELAGGAAIDYVDLVYNNRLARRVVPRQSYPTGGAAPAPGAAAERSPDAPGDRIRSRITLELGWGPRNTAVDWDVDFGISDGTVLDVDPRFRGHDVLSPEQEAEGGESTFFSSWRHRDARSVHFETVTRGNPTSSTSGTQGVSLEVEVPPETRVWAEINGVRTETTIERLMAGGKSGHLRHEIDSPAWLFHRVPEEHELYWNLDLGDFTPDMRPGDFFYLRVRQENNQWAWGSPIFCRD